MLKIREIETRICQPDLNGFGVSASSNESVLRTLSRYCLVNGGPPAPEKLAKEALKLERRLADGRAIAANDVYPIVFGGIQMIHTYSVRVMPEPIRGVEEWLGQHLTVAFQPNGSRHDAAKMLKKLVQNRQLACYYIRKFSQFAAMVAVALKTSDLVNLAWAMTQYRELFDKWTQYAYTSETQGIMQKLQAALPSKVMSWKPPGAGACGSLIILSPNKEARDLVIQFLRNEGWCASPAVVTGGASTEILPHNKVRITAGYRLDLIGAADLGQDSTIRQCGCCIGVAIEPRAEMFLYRN